MYIFMSINFKIYLKLSLFQKRKTVKFIDRKPKWTSTYRSHIKVFKNLPLKTQMAKPDGFKLTYLASRKHVVYVIYSLGKDGEVPSLLNQILKLIVLHCDKFTSSWSSISHSLPTNLLHTLTHIHTHSHSHCPNLWDWSRQVNLVKDSRTML